jgi:two-component system chemotaxis response regulator CheY
MNILFIDDDFFFQKAMSFFFDELGHNTQYASDGSKGLELLRKSKNIELLICDLDMPVLPGHEFIAEVKELYPTQRPVIIFVSGLKKGKELLSKNKVEYDYYVEKPVDVNEFAKLLEKIAKAGD